MSIVNCCLRRSPMVATRRHAAAERRRHLLNYLRQHLEELRPYAGSGNEPVLTSTKLCGKASLRDAGISSGIGTDKMLTLLGERQVR